MAGKSFGRYRLVRLLARGGMAEVYLAVLQGAAGFEKRLALKKILPTFEDLEEFTQLFTDEARISVTLNHSNVVQVFDFGVHNGEYFIAMEYVDGPDLEKLLIACRKLRRQLSVDAILYLGTRIAAALEYAHSRTDERGRSLELIHRDVSPPNILISVQGEVKLTDFGVARYAQRISKSRPGVVRGKYAYMSPEQLKGEALDSRSDIFSFGTLLFEMLTSVNPFLGDTDYQTMEAVVSASPRSPLDYRSGAPRDLVRIIRRCMEPDANRRYQTAGEARRDLAELMFNRGVIDDPALLIEEMWDLFPRQLSRRGAAAPGRRTPAEAPPSVALGMPRMRSGAGVTPGQEEWGGKGQGPVVIGPDTIGEDLYGEDDLTIPHLGNPDAIPTQPLDEDRTELGPPAEYFHDEEEPEIADPLAPPPRAARAKAVRIDPEGAVTPTSMPALKRKAPEDDGGLPGAPTQRAADEAPPVVDEPPVADEPEAPEPPVADEPEPPPADEPEPPVAGLADQPSPGDTDPSVPAVDAEIPPRVESAPEIDLDATHPPAEPAEPPPASETLAPAPARATSAREDARIRVGRADDPDETQSAPNLPAVAPPARSVDDLSAPTIPPGADPEKAPAPKAQPKAPRPGGPPSRVAARQPPDDEAEGSPWWVVGAALLVIGALVLASRFLDPTPAALPPPPDEPFEVRVQDSGAQDSEPGHSEPDAPPEQPPSDTPEEGQPQDELEPQDEAQPQGEAPKSTEPEARPEPEATPAADAPTPTPAAKIAEPTPRRRVEASQPKPKAKPKPEPKPKPKPEADPTLVPVARAERSKPVEKPEPVAAVEGIQVTVVTEPPGAELNIDGKSVGLGSWTGRARAGSILEVTARKIGYLSTTRMVRVDTDGKNVLIELSPEIEDAEGVVSITSTPWAYVAVDGRILGQVTPVRLTLSAGEHTIVLENPEVGWSVTRTVTVVGDETLDLDVRR